jgi:hypothetical protein
MIQTGSTEATNMITGPNVFATNHPFPLERFDWGGMVGVLVGEASDLAISPGTPPWSRLFNDACDAGIAIRSGKTGRTVRFYLEREDRDREGEIQGWWFKVYDRDAHGHGVIRVLIIND